MVLAKNLGLKEAFGYVTAVTASEYFRQYEMWSPSSQLVSPPIVVTFGGCRNKGEDSFQLVDVAPYMDSLLRRVAGDPAACFEKLHLVMNASDRIAERFKFSDGLEMNFVLSVKKYGLDKYFFSAGPRELDALAYDGDKNLYARDKKHHDKWKLEAVNELKKNLARTRKK